MRCLSLEPTHSRFLVSWEGIEFAFETQLVGKFQIENTLAALALLLAQGFNPTTIASALLEFEPVCGRMERIGAAAGVSGGGRH